MSPSILPSQLSPPFPIPSTNQRRTTLPFLPPSFHLPLSPLHIPSQLSSLQPILLSIPTVALPHGEESTFLSFPFPFLLPSLLSFLPLFSLLFFLFLSLSTVALPHGEEPPFLSLPSFLSFSLTSPQASLSARGTTMRQIGKTSR